MKDRRILLIIGLSLIILSLLLILKVSGAILALTPMVVRAKKKEIQSFKHRVMKIMWDLREEIGELNMNPARDEMYGLITHAFVFTNHENFQRAFDVIQDLKTMFQELDIRPQNSIIDIESLLKNLIQLQKELEPSHAGDVRG
ncbi:MAG: hypothetical protein GXO75_08430 [Calditrichaeota bacterium]|nr:hypothetical protein [Calditrichota bacterium]